MEQTPTLDFTPLRQALRRYVTAEVIPLERENNLSWDVAPPKDLRRQVRVRARELGLYAPDMPQEVGGGGLSFLGRCVLEMELHSHDTVFFEDVLGGGGGPSSIMLHASEAQRARWLAPLMAGETTTCFALSEADAGSDASALQTRAVVDDAGFALSGSKSIVSNGPHADFATVFAVVQGPEGTPAGVTAFLVDAETPGYLRARDHTCMGFTGFQGELAFDNVRLGEENVLGQVGAGFPMALAWINGNRVRTAAMTVGVARRALARSAGYAASRQQFGQPIASFQAIQLKLADMATELYAAELMVERTAAMLDQGLDIRKEGAMTKLFCSEMVNRAAYEAIQVHGGIGCLAETGIERIYRMVRIFTILEGTSEMQRVTIAGRLMRELAR
ncbi:MAG: acyl-CoA dehydrogenase family protein [Dehalococcoidia bacterium]|nr:acyl-CoA dehydrogenase [Chloroflexi bacterium CFX7]NUQ55280.1 acyl-CoA dehydrogenase family protein [Dehalococcoidia bacterium]RIL04170.1 MAG: acyl-CoA dehydrogenase [bacterium]